MLRSDSPRNVRVCAAITLLIGVLLFTACTPEQTATFDRINDIRVQNGLNTLLPSPPAMAKAQAWAEHLAATGQLAHSDLWADLPPGGQSVGENVGMGGSIDAVYDAFMQSPKHRANLLDPRWNWSGTGVARSADGAYYIVQVFALY
jgi:uncharacterized protein YkwD